MNDLAALERRLADALAGPLPGGEAHVLMAPRPRLGWRPGGLPTDGRDAAALLLLYPVEGSPHLLLTRRTDTLPTHRGQISLPGGRIEPGESREQAALREAHEEIGLDPADLRLLGSLSPLHIPVSGFVLHPVVAVLDRRQDWRPLEREVAEILEPPLHTLWQPDTIRVENWTIQNESFVVPSFQLDGDQVWGATAMVLAELLCLLGRPPRPHRSTLGDTP